MLKNDVYIIVGVVLFIMAFFLLAVNSFFFNWSSSVFSNIVTPLIAIVTAIVLIRTLRQGQKQHQEAIAINQYKILLDDLKTLIKEFEELRFTFPDNIFTKEEIEKYKDKNGIYYSDLFASFFFYKLRNDEKKYKEPNQLMAFKENIM